MEVSKNGGISGQKYLRLEAFKNRGISKWRYLGMEVYNNARWLQMNYYAGKMRAPRS